MQNQANAVTNNDLFNESAEMPSNVAALLNSVRLENEWITPERARQYLQLNVSNRPFKPSALRKYSKELQDGKWMLNGEGIKFSSSGKLIDGQNRLQAIVNTGIAAPITVARGVNDAAFQVIDSGVKRSDSDTLATAFAGLSRWQATAASKAIKLLHVYKVGEEVSVLDRPVVTGYELVAGAQRHPHLIKIAKQLEHHALRNQIPFSEGEELFFRYIFSKHALPPVVKAFMDGLQLGAGLDLSDPLFHLRALMLNGSRKYSTGYRISTVIRLWNKRDRAKKHTRSAVNNMLRGASESYVLLPKVL